MAEHIARAEQITRHPGWDISDSMVLSYSVHKPVVGGFSSSIQLAYTGSSTFPKQVKVDLVLLASIQFLAPGQKPDNQTACLCRAEAAHTGLNPLHHPNSRNNIT